MSNITAEDATNILVMIERAVKAEPAPGGVKEVVTIGLLIQRLVAIKDGRNVEDVPASN